jgi:SPP1 family predicted phage head-tail adaptor
MGGLVDSWANTITVWGSVTPLQGNERQRAAAIDATLSHKIVVRYNSRITPDDEITYNSRTFRVGVPVNVDEASKVSEVLAEEVL